MIYSNLAGTTNNQFKVGYRGDGQILSGNAYDMWWKVTNPVTNQSNNNIVVLENGNDLNYCTTFGQYMRPYSTIGLVNSPTIYEFIMVVEPSSGNDLKWLVQKIVDTNGDQFVRYKKADSAFSSWRRRAWADELPIHATGGWIPTVSSGFTIVNIYNNIYTRMGLYCCLKAYMQIQRTNGNHLDIGGLPYNIKNGQMTGSIGTGDEFQKSLNYTSGETITTFLPRSNVPASPSANFFNIGAQIFMNDSSTTVIIGELGSMMVPNVTLHVEFDLMYVIV